MKRIKFKNKSEISFSDKPASKKDKLRGSGPVVIEKLKEEKPFWGGSSLGMRPEKLKKSHE